MLGADSKATRRGRKRRQRWEERAGRGAKHSMTADSSRTLGMKAQLRVGKRRRVHDHPRQDESTMIPFRRAWLKATDRSARVAKPCWRS